MLLTTLFTPDEMVLMNNLADTTARVVRTEKNTSNSGAAIGTLLGRLFRKMGDTNVANAAAEWFLVNGAVRSYAGARVKSAVKGVAGQRARGGLSNLILGGGTGFGSTPSTEEPAAPPQARVMPSAPPTRGVPGLGGGEPAPAAPAVAQGPTDMGSREMLDQLFPFG